MLYDCKTNNQSQKRYTMDSLKEKDNPATKPPKRPRIEVNEELMRQMIARQAPLDSPVVRRIPDPEEENTAPTRERHPQLHPQHRFRLLKEQTSTLKQEA